MDPIALRHAQVRLQKAEAALLALQSARSFDHVETAWSDFLLAASAIYSKLDQGAKSSARSTAWFGRVKRLRKTDPLLRYLHHARNSDEHGIEDTTHRKALGAEWIWPDGQKTLIRFDDPNVQLRETSSGDVPLDRLIHYTDLVPVTDRRYGDSFEPPDTHLDRAVTTRDPVQIANIAIGYLQSLVAEAKEL
jgi:hypothetical protein